MCAWIPITLTIVMILLFILHQVHYKKYKGNENLLGKVIIITGGTSGIGEACVIELLLKGATIIFTGRRTEKAKNVVKTAITRLKYYNYLELPLKKPETEERAKAIQNGKWTEGGKNFESKYLYFRYIEQSKISSCNSFTNWFNENFEKLDILVNNAGLISPYDRKKTETGMEWIMAVNHLSHFMMTDNLLEKLKQAQQARVIITASKWHNKSSKHNPKIDLEDFFDEKVENYKGDVWYGRSKFANVAFSNWLNEYFVEKGIDAKSVSLHPGEVATDIIRDFPLREKVFFRSFTLVARTCFEGAQTIVMAACIDFDELVGGEYYDNCKIGEMNEDARDMRYVGKFVEKSAEILRENGAVLKHFC